MDHKAWSWVLGSDETNMRCSTYLFGCYTNPNIRDAV